MGPAGDAWQLETGSAEDTARLAEAFGRHAEAGHVFGLVGPLGAGKTCFAQGLGRGLGVSEPVTSPTFTLIHRYEGRLPLLHLDAYRLDDPRELVLLGLDDLLAQDVVTVVEWAERLERLLPADALWVAIDPGPGPDRRRLAVRATGPRHAALLAIVREEWRQP